VGKGLCEHRVSVRAGCSRGQLRVARLATGGAAALGGEHARARTAWRSAGQGHGAIRGHALRVPGGVRAAWAEQAHGQGGARARGRGRKGERRKERRERNKEREERKEREREKEKRKRKEIKEGKRKEKGEGGGRVGADHGGDCGWSATHATFARGEKGNRVGADCGKAVARGRRTTEQCGTGRRSCPCRLSR
jgi:hypothetical protein